MIMYYRRRLIALFKNLNKLKANPKKIALNYSIQEEVIYVTRQIEYKVRKAKANRADLNNILKNDRLPKSQSVQLKQIIENNESTIDSYQVILSILRDVGDGIAFIYLNKWNIKPLCLAKERAGFISGKKGLRLELACFRILKERKIVSILNDITNSIRYGDITLCHNKIPTVIEVKSGSMSKRDKRQFERTKNVIDYLKNDEGIGVYPNMADKKLVRTNNYFTESNHRNKLNKLIITAFVTGKSQLSKIENGLYYHIAFSGESPDDVLSKLSKHNEAIWYIHFINDEKRAKKGYYPFTLSISNPDYLFEFYNGSIVIAVYIDINAISKELSKKELVLNIINDEHNLFSISHQKPDLGMIVVSRHFFNRVGAEFLSLKWLINEITAKYLNAIENYTISDIGESYKEI